MNEVTPDSRVGSQFGRYRLTQLLGRGGMGEVYEAEDTVKERVVALKLLSPAFSHDPSFVERLQEEVTTARRFQEPHAVPIHDYGEIDGQLFLETRLIDGPDLATLLQRFGRLSPPRAVAVVRQVATALDTAHAAGVIHGDVKSHNILVTRDECAYLVDFGIADAATYSRLTQVGDPVGTAKYAAPERFTGAEATHRVDIYALTCVLHECLTGSPPYLADDPAKVIAMHLTQPIPRPSHMEPDVPGALDDVIARGMAKDPQTRYASAGELAVAAYQALDVPGQNLVDEIVDRAHVASSPTSGLDSAPRPTPPPQQPADDYTEIPTGDAHAVPPLAPANSAPLAQFDAFSLRPETVRKRRRRRGLVLGAIAGVVLLVVAGVLFRLLNPSRISSTTLNTATPTASSAAPPEVQARLMDLLPAGYPSGVCKQATPPKDALAAVSCGANVDPDGPPSATYTLFPDTASLSSALNDIVASASVMECPGRIQSPGPWHRNATPGKSSGTLLCATQQGHPTVTWTNDAGLLLSIAKTHPDGPTIEQLYAWWRSHS